MILTVDKIPETASCATHKKFQGEAPSIITIHWVGPYPGQTPEMVRKWWIDSKGEASAHFIIKDDNVLQCWDISQVAYHAGCRAGNESSLGIEIIPENVEGKFSDKSISSLHELLDMICKQLHKQLKAIPIIRHFDWTGKGCPLYYTDNNEWQKLLNQIK